MSLYGPFFGKSNTMSYVVISKLSDGRDIRGPDDSPIHAPRGVAPPSGSLDVSGARLSLARATAHRGGTTSRRRVLVAGREEDRVPKRARAGQPLLSNLRPGSRHWRDHARVAWSGQDHLRVLPPGHRRDRVRVDARRPEIKTASRR